MLVHEFCGGSLCDRSELEVIDDPDDYTKSRQGSCAAHDQQSDGRGFLRQPGQEGFLIEQIVRGNGFKFTSLALKRWPDQHHVKLSFIQLGKC